MTHRLAGAIALSLIFGLSIAAAIYAGRLMWRGGRVRSRSGSWVLRSEDPFYFWLLLVLYAVLAWVAAFLPLLAIGSAFF